MSSHQSIPQPANATKKSDIRPHVAPIQSRPVFAQPKIESTRSNEDKLAQMRAKREASANFGSTLLTPESVPHTPPPLQPKLTIGQPGDKYEQEADRVARQVVDQDKEQRESEETVLGVIHRQGANLTPTNENWGNRVIRRTIAITTEGNESGVADVDGRITEVEYEDHPRSQEQLESAFDTRPHHEQYKEDEDGRFIEFVPRGFLLRHILAFMLGKTPSEAASDLDRHGDLTLGHDIHPNDHTHETMNCFRMHINQEIARLVNDIDNLYYGQTFINEWDPLERPRYPSRPVGRENEVRSWIHEGIDKHIGSMYSIDNRDIDFEPMGRRRLKYNDQVEERTWNAGSNVWRGGDSSGDQDEDSCTVQPKLESPSAARLEPPPPYPQRPATQLKGGLAPVKPNPIQRQCAECAKEEEQKGEARKDLEEIGIQTKLTVGSPGDTYEHEADRVASRVMSMSAPADSSASVQRQFDTDQALRPHQICQRAPSVKSVMQTRIDPRGHLGQMIQRAPQIDGNQVSGDLETRLNASKGGGSPLSTDVRGFMEPRFGVDFSGVRVHTGGEAVQMNQELGALAFTHGSDVYFGQGKSPGNNELMAHELTHVVQQSGGAVQQMQPQRHQGQESEEHKENKTERRDNRKAGIENLSDIETHVVQLFTAPPGTPPATGVRNGTLNPNRVPIESHVTTRHGQSNNLSGSVPSVSINGWPYIQQVQASGSWVRFHLVNRQIGGLGNQQNLAPTSQATNMDPNWRNFEETCKYHVQQNTSVHVTVDVGYPQMINGAGANTVQGNQHFYPNQISGRCYLWDAGLGIYRLFPNTAPARQNTFEISFLPYPLLPPANANKTNLRDKNVCWLRNILYRKATVLTTAKARILADALKVNSTQDPTIDDLIQASNEEIPEMQLLDALDTFVSVELDLPLRVPDPGRGNILNGTYHI